jgi:hypothetical protein
MSAARSIGAVAGGIVVGVGLTLITDLVLHRAGVFPPLGQHTGDGPLAVATTYRVVYGIAGAYVTARLAATRPMAHAVAGGLIGFAVSLAGAIATWNRDLGAHWYPVALVLTAVPCAWIGGLVRERQLQA